MRTDSRSLRYAVLLSALILVIAAVLVLDPSVQNAQRKKIDSTAAHSIPAPKTSFGMVNLPGRSFDPLTSAQTGSVTQGDGLAASGSEGYYIVQFGKAADDAMLNRLRSSGVEIIQYIPNRAFYVYARGGAISNAVENPEVRWAGRLLPEHKIPALLTAQLNAAASRSAPTDSVGGLQMASKRTAVFDVAVFKRADLKSVSTQVAGLAGGVVRSAIHLPGNFFNIVRVEAPLETITLAANVPDVFRIDAWTPPSREDERAAQIVAGNYVSATALDPAGYDPLAQFGVDGSGVTVSVVDDGIGIPGDGGYYITSSNAVNGPPRGTSAGAAGHGHLNATIIAGTTPFGVLDPTGYNYGLGVAPGSNVINIPFLRAGYGGNEATTVNDTVATAGPNGVPGFISNNSWGGGVNGNGYDTYTAQYDGFARDASSAGTVDPLLIIFSAGNSGSAGLTRPKMAKNAISVGNLENIRIELLSSFADNMDDLSPTSSSGPGPDGRIKPDLAAPGTAITGGLSGPGISGMTDLGDYHRWSSGTSHAAPQVAGAAALFTQFWKSNNAGLNPSPALVKAALINGARDANGVSTSASIPNGFEGWGRVYLKNVLNTGASVTYVNEEDTLGDIGNVKVYNGTVPDPSRPLRVTLVWTDPPAAADPALVNDLDLEVTAGGVNYKGNVLSGGMSVAGGSADYINNVENVSLPPGLSGPLSVRVRAKGLNGDGVLGNADLTDQNFALVIYNGSVSLDTAAFPIYETPTVLSGNGVLEPNECNLIRVPITNLGQSTATGISATLATSTPGVSVFAGTSTYPDLASGATAFNQGTFQLATDATAACLTDVDLTLTVTYAGSGSPAVYNFKMPIGQAGGTNYAFTSSGGATISPGGSLVSGSSVDDAVVNFSVPFAFSVYGTNVPAGSNIRLGTNGFVRIETGGLSLAAPSNEALPATAAGSFPAASPVLMPYWDDLDMRPSVTTGGGIYTEVTGSPGSRTLKIEWRARSAAGVRPPEPPDTNFAVYFHEGSSNFEYVYAQTGLGSAASGASATVGVQGAATGSVFTQYSRDSASLSAGQMLSAALAPVVCSFGNGVCVATAAPVQITGRVVTTDGRGIRNARLTLVDETGTNRFAVTNSFGYFRFEAVPAGETYVVAVAARGYFFESRVVEVYDSISDLTFTPAR